MRLTWKASSDVVLLDASPLLPETLADADDVNAVALRTTRGALPVSELFAVTQHDDVSLAPPRVTLVGLPITHGLGANMAGGDLVIEGDAGDDLGASMTAGTIRVTGSAGDRTGGPAVGSRRGMNGGVIHIAGNAGEHTGTLMRRGMIVVQGKAGRHTASRMLAGTIVLGETPDGRIGVGMRRGTVIVTSPAQDGDGVGNHFTRDGVFPGSTLAFMGLVMREAFGGAGDAAAADWQGDYELFSGDRFELHKGELWRRASPA